MPQLVGIGRLMGPVRGGGDPTDYGLLAYVQDGRAQLQYNSTSPAALYIADRDEIWAGWEAWDGTQAITKIRVYNRATPLWGAQYKIANTGLQGDSHGVPALVYDGASVHCFFGAHNGAISVRSCSASNPSSWTASTAVSGLYSYPRPVCVTPGSASGIYLQARVEVDADQADKLILRKSNNITPGSVAFDAEQVMIYLDSNSRVYGGNNTLDNGIIWFAATRATFADNVRQNVYIFGIDTNNGDRLTNWAGDFTLATGSWPCDLAAANANFRVVTQTGNVGGNTPTLIKLGDGSWVLQYSEGDSVLTDVPIKVLALRSAGVGQAWTAQVSAIEVAEMPVGDPRYQVPTVAVYGSAGKCQFAYPVTNSGANGLGGGDAWRRIMNADGSLEEAEPLITCGQASGGDGVLWKLNRFTPVQDGPAEARFVFSQDNGDQTKNTGYLRGFMHGDDDFLGTPDYGPDLSSWLVRLASRPSTADLDSLYLGIKGLRTSLWYPCWWEGYWEAADTEAMSLIPFRNPNNTKTKSGTITFTANVGPRGNGTTGVYTTGWLMNAVPKTSIIQAVYCPGGPLNTNGRDFSSAGATAIQCYVTQASGNALVRFSSSTTYQPTCDGTGLLLFVRDGANQRLFQDRVEKGSGAAATDIATTAEARLEFKAGASSFGSNQHGIDQVMCYFPPVSITAGSLQQSDVDALDAALRYFL